MTDKTVPEEGQYVAPEPYAYPEPASIPEAVDGQGENGGGR